VLGAVAGSARHHLARARLEGDAVGRLALPAGAGDAGPDRRAVLIAGAGVIAAARPPRRAAGAGAVVGLALLVLAVHADDVGVLVGVAHGVALHGQGVGRQLVLVVGRQRADEVDQRVAQRDAGVELGGVALEHREAGAALRDVIVHRHAVLGE